jgi:DNA invertase Pin-like site-specific DNA recombinase
MSFCGANLPQLVDHLSGGTPAGPRRRGAGAVHRGGERAEGNTAELEKALTLAKLTGATLVVARLDRLSRNAAFLLTLRDSGVRFLACDMPLANGLNVGVIALVAQQEREAISRRTGEALAAVKARGVKLGNPNGAAALRRAGKGGVALQEAVRKTTMPSRRNWRRWWRRSRGRATPRCAGSQRS